MTFKGDLKEICLFDVFQNVSHNRLTGALHVRTEREERWVYFERGLVRLVSLGTGVGLPMRDFLVRRGWVTEEDLAAAVHRHRRGRPALRNVLVKEKKISEDEFIAAMHERVQEFLYDVCGLKEATFEFRDGPPPEGVFDREQRGIEISLDPMPILMEAARREDEWSRIRKVVASERDLFVRVGDAPPDGDPDLHMVWSCLDGESEIGSLEGIVPLGRFELCDAVTRLVNDGLARPVTASEIVARAEAALQSGDHAKTRSLLEHALQLERNNRELRRMLAELYQALEDRKQAAEAWAILGYQAMLAGDDAEALEAYQRALELDGTDLGLREKCCELLERAGSTRDYQAAIVGFVEQLREFGLMDRARQVLERAMQRPDLADRPELLERLARVEKEAGQGDEGQQRLLRAAATAQKLGDRQRAEVLLEIGEQLFPESEIVGQQLSDLRSHRRERRRRYVRRLLSLVLLGCFGSATAFLAWEETSVRSAVGLLLRDIPVAVATGRSMEPLAHAQAEIIAHPWAPSRSLLRDLATGLAEAELLQALEDGRRGHYREALARLDALRTLVGDGASVARVAQLHEELQRQKRLYDRLAPWFAREGTGVRDPGVFRFAPTDVSQVLSLYDRFGDAGRQLARRRLVHLASPLTLPLFTRHYLAGETAEHDEEDREIRLFDLVGTLAARAREPGHHGDDHTRAAVFDAWEVIVGAWLAGGEARARARQLMPFFIELPNTLPGDREGLWRLLLAAFDPRTVR